MKNKHIKERFNRDADNIQKSVQYCLGILHSDALPKFEQLPISSTHSINAKNSINTQIEKMKSKAELQIQLDWLTYVSNIRRNLLSASHGAHDVFKVWLAAYEKRLRRGYDYRFGAKPKNAIRAEKRRYQLASLNENTKRLNLAYAVIAKQYAAIDDIQKLHSINSKIEAMYMADCNSAGLHRMRQNKSNRYHFLHNPGISFDESKCISAMIYQMSLHNVLQIEHMLVSLNAR